MIGTTSIKLGETQIDLDFNLFAYEQLTQLLAKYADLGVNIDLSPETFDELFTEVQKTSFLMAAQMVIYSGYCGYMRSKGKRPKIQYDEIIGLISKADQDQLLEVIKFFWGTMMHEQEGEKKEQKPVSKKKVSPTGKSKRSV